MIAVAIVVTTVLLSRVNYGMFQNRVMDDLRTYGRVIFAHFLLPLTRGQRKRNLSRGSRRKDCA